MISQTLARKFTTSAARWSSQHGGPTKPGDNLPFSLDNPYRLTFVFGLFIGSSLGLPFIMLKYQLTK